MENGRADPSEIVALEIKEKGAEPESATISATIGIGRLIFVILAVNCAMGPAAQKTVSALTRRRSAPPSKSMALRHFLRGKQA